MMNIFKSLYNLFNFKEKSDLKTIAELQSFNILQNKIEKEKRARTYISEINQKYNKISKRENNLTKKGY